MHKKQRTVVTADWPSFATREAWADLSSVQPEEDASAEAVAAPSAREAPFAVEAALTLQLPVLHSLHRPVPALRQRRLGRMTFPLCQRHAEGMYRAKSHVEASVWEEGPRLRLTC